LCSLIFNFNFNKNKKQKMSLNRSDNIDFLEATFRKIFPQDQEFRDKAVERLEQLTMPHWALGDLMDMAVDLAGMTRSMQPPVGRKKVVVMVGDHGVTAEGVSKFPSEVTAQMVYNFVAGGAGINALARQAGAEVVVVDMGCATDLSDLAQKGKIISKNIGAGTANIAHITGGKNIHIRSQLVSDFNACLNCHDGMGSGHGRTMGNICSACPDIF